MSNHSSAFVLKLYSGKRELLIIAHVRATDVREIREASGMNPSVAHYVVLGLRRNPVPRNIPVIDAGGRSEIRSARMGKQGITQGTQEGREIFLGSR